MNNVVVYKNRTNVVSVGLGIDVSADVITSEIREKANTDSPLIASWVVDFATDGTDGELILTLDDSVTSQVVAKSGFMDFKRTSDGEPYNIFDKPIKVEFKETVTA